jgi:hypothetical protein
VTLRAEAVKTIVPPSWSEVVVAGVSVMLAG